MDFSALNLNNSPDLKILLEVLCEKFKDDEVTSKKLEALSDSRAINVKKLKERWANKKIPPKNQTHCREVCIKFFSQTPEERYAEGSLTEENFKSIYTKDYILHDPLTGTRAYDPYRQAFEKIQFAGVINFSESFEPLVSFHSDSTSVNIFDTWLKLIDKGESLGLGFNQWNELILRFASKFCKELFPELVLRSENPRNNSCFFHLIDSVSSDFEISKLRSSLSTTTRKLNEPIFIVSIKLLSLYRAIIQMTFPGLKVEILEKRANHLAKRAILEFCHEKVKKLALAFCDRQLSLQREVSLNELCRFMDELEHDNKDFALREPATLPSRLVYVDKISMDLGSGATDIDINYTQARNNWQKRSSSKRNNPQRRSNSQNSSRSYSSSKSPRFRRNSRGRFVEANKTKTQGSNSNEYKKQERGRPRERKLPGKNSKPARQSPRFKRTDSGNYRRTSSTRPRSYSQKSSSTDRKKSQDIKESKRRSRSSSAIRCYRCGGWHEARVCKTYPNRSDSTCGRCGLQHSTADCLMTKKARE